MNPKNRHTGDYVNYTGITYNIECILNQVSPDIENRNMIGKVILSLMV
jgi:hypothetical protein